MISIPVIYYDNTINLSLMIVFDSISLLMIFMTSRVLAYGYKNPSKIDFMVNIFMFFWFCFVIYRDLITPYCTLIKIFYVSIDISSIFFIIDTFLNMILEKVKIPSLSQEKERIKNIFRLFAMGICLFSYSLVLRGILSD